MAVLNQAVFILILQYCFNLQNRGKNAVRYPALRHIKTKITTELSQQSLMVSYLYHNNHKFYGGNYNILNARDLLTF